LIVELPANLFDLACFQGPTIKIKPHLLPDGSGIIWEKLLIKIRPSSPQLEDFGCFVKKEKEE